MERNSSVTLRGVPTCHTLFLCVPLHPFPIPYSSPFSFLLPFFYASYTWLVKYTQKMISYMYKIPIPQDICKRPTLPHYPLANSIKVMAGEINNTKCSYCFHRQASRNHFEQRNDIRKVIIQECVSVNLGQEEEGSNCDRLYSNCGDNCNCGNA